jgi:hypothetical protein
VDKWIQHAKLYGTEMVAETAAEQGWSAEELAELIEALDTIHAVHLNDKKMRAKLGLTGVMPNYRRTYLERAETMIDEI